MYVPYLFLISALLVVNVRSDCDTYIDCFSSFVRDFFTSIEIGNVKTNDTLNPKTDVINLKDNQELNVDSLISDLTNLIKDLNKNITETNTLHHVNDKTKIVIKTFDVDDDFVSEKLIPSSEEVTTEFNVAEALNLQETTTTIYPTPVGQNISVIPLKNVKENEISDSVDVELSLDDENFTDYPNIDYIEIYKDTTNEIVEYTTELPTSVEYHDLRSEINKQETEIQNLIENSVNLLDEEALSNLIQNVTENKDNLDGNSALSRSVFPWIAAIFLKNDSKGNQFDYFCDGAIISDRAVLTSGRCVYHENSTYKSEDFLVILGKSSLQASSGNEKILQVKEVKLHENFTLEKNTATNDLAILILEEPIIFNEAIAIANLDDVEELYDNLREYTSAVTTAWSLSGDLTLIYFDKEKSKACAKDNKVENTFCATYGNVPFCPSYGGLHVIQRLDKLYLHGIRTGDPMYKGYCINKDINFTSLQNHTKWISEVVENKI